MILTLDMDFMQILTLNIKELTRPVLEFGTIEFTDHFFMILSEKPFS